MNITREYEPDTDLEAFLERHGLSIVISKRPRTDCLPIFMARFSPAVEISHNGCLMSLSGNGYTEDSAIEDLARKASNNKLIVGAYTENRKEISPVKIIVK